MSVCGIGFLSVRPWATKTGVLTGKSIYRFFIVFSKCSDKNGIEIVKICNCSVSNPIEKIFVLKGQSCIGSVWVLNCFSPLLHFVFFSERAMLERRPHQTGLVSLYYLSTILSKCMRILHLRCLIINLRNPLEFPLCSSLWSSDTRRREIKSSRRGQTSLLAFSNLLGINKVRWFWLFWSVLATLSFLSYGAW